MKAVADDLKGIYHSVTVDAAELALNEFSAKWDEKYPSISRSWRNKWITLSLYLITHRKYAKLSTQPMLSNHSIA